MDSHQIVQLLGILAIVLAAARLLGSAARWIGQPAVLGELLAGVFLGASVLGLIDPSNHDRPGTLVLEFLQELGVVILLFEIGLETDLVQMLRAGATSTAVAIVGVALPFAAGYLVCYFFREPGPVCIVAGAALTATSVGITARVLNDLGRLHEPESQIVLGAAVIDDILGLIILTIVSGLSTGNAPTVADVAGITGLAVGFLIGAIAVGSFVVPPLARWLDHLAIPGMLTTLALLLAFGLAWGAEMAGSASIIGAFVAGLLLRRTPKGPRY
ncbi:MAG: cation:proton antiporter [Thermoguttaceae bacterium]